MGSWTRWLVVVCWHFMLLYISFSNSLCHSHDSFALLHFKTSFTIINTYDDSCYDPKTETWENGTDCCSWLGVTCHPISGRVIGLDLSCSGLYGKINENSTLFGLNHLHSLNLAHNVFLLSPVSSPFGGLMSLTNLNLSYSNFEGEISSQISHLSKLQSLDLSFNFQLELKESTWKRLLHNATVLRYLHLDGIDMTSISIGPLNRSSSLVSLSLSETGLRGKLTNDTLCLPKLEHLYLSFCDFEGSIPISLSNLTHLTSFDLSNNNLNSSIPDSFSNLTHLTSLDLSNNNLNSSIPSSLLTLPRLTFLYLHGNYLSGQIPNVFPKLNDFEELDLSSNNLGGELPSTISNLQHIIHLHLSGNKLSGQIPDVFAGLTKLNTLSLKDNILGGELPSTISNLQHLIDLDLSQNKLSGQIPDVFAGLTKLNTLYLSDNNLRGQIPSSLFDLTQLSELDFSNNKLEGPLPNKITGFSNLIKLWMNHNSLNGTIPSWCLSLPTLLSLDLSNNHFTGQISEISSYSLESLDLCHNKLHGNIPESIFSLVNLIDLCLSSNSFSFSGPLNFSLLSSLERLDLSSMGLTEFPKLSRHVPFFRKLDLSDNKLNGTIPEWLHEMDTLQYLNLSKNLFTTIGNFSRDCQLSILDLSFNLISGDISSSICNASLLLILNLSYNKLSGIIPQCIANLSFLVVLDLQMNELCGTLPSTFANNIWLTYLNVNDNKLQGILPESLSNCTSLEILNLGNNQIEDTFPLWLQSLSNLKVLILRDNKFHGTITGLKTEFGFSSLVIFDISSNNFSGPIPKALIKKFKAMKNVIQDEVGSISQQYLGTTRLGKIYSDSVTVTVKAIRMTLTKIPTNFVNIDFSRNKFEGEIPNVIGELHSLRGLNFSHNRLSGPIPQSMGNLTLMESLDLSSNMLTGRIPTELTSLNFLEVLNLSLNHLVGEIPQGKQFNTFSNDSYEGDSGLCGVPLSKKCSNDPEQHSPPSQKLWTEERFGFGWKPVAIGYGCGMVIGVGIGSFVFIIRKPELVVRMVEG